MSLTKFREMWTSQQSPKTTSSESMHPLKMGAGPKLPNIKICAVISLLTLAMHYILWTSSRNNCLHDMPRVAEAVAEAVSEAMALEMPLEKPTETSNSTLPEDRDSPDDVVDEDAGSTNLVEQVENPVGPVASDSSDEREEKTCESGKYAFDSQNNACMDLTWTTNDQVIFASDANNVSYLYCGIPKNGCTYHLGLMYRIAGDPEYNEGGVAVHNPQKKIQYRLSQKDPERITQFLTDPSIPKYMVVRNPLTRILSAYIDKVERYLPEGERTAGSFRNWVFKEFKQPGEMMNWAEVNPHWRPQTQFCGFNVRDIYKYFTVFRTENPQQYVDFMYKVIPGKYLDEGWSSRNLSFRESVLGPRERTGNTEERFLEYFKDLEVFDYATSALHEDIARLNYTTEVAKQRETIAALQLQSG